MNKDKLKVVIDSLFEIRRDFSSEELQTTIEKNGIIVSDMDKLIRILIEIKIISKVGEDQFAVLPASE